MLKDKIEKLFEAVKLPTEVIIPDEVISDYLSDYHEGETDGLTFKGYIGDYLAETFGYQVKSFKIKRVKDDYTAYNIAWGDIYGPPKRAR